LVKLRVATATSRRPTMFRGKNGVLAGFYTLNELLLFTFIAA